LEKGEMIAVEGLARRAGEGAGAVRLAGNVGWNREPLTDPFPAGEVEDPAVAVGENDHPLEARPSEADAPPVTRAVDRIRATERLAVEPIGPAAGIIMDPDRRARAPDVDVMGQCEIAEAELDADLAERAGKLGFTLEIRNRPDEGIYPIEHLPL